MVSSFVLLMQHIHRTCLSSLLHVGRWRVSHLPPPCCTFVSYRLLPDLDGDSEQHQPSSAGRPPAAAPGMAAAAGAPGSGGRGGLRRRVGSTASVEEDIFSSVGGLELGHDLSGPDAAGSAAAAAAAEQLLAGASSAAAGSLSVPSVASLADLAPVDTPSRTLFVQNVAVDVPDDELRRLFSSHGDLRTLYTACKARGLVIVGYFDLRSAIAAATQLSGYPLAGRLLEVAFSAPKKGETNQVNQVGGSGYARPGFERLCVFGCSGV